MAFVQQHSLDALPPIDVYQIGSAYFVQDGHHRVSIARQLGIEFVTAYVTEVQTRVPLTPDADWDALIRNAEYAAFLEYTQLDRLRPKTDFTVSVPGQYAKLEDHIEVHRYFIEVAEDRELDFEEAVCRWHDEAYRPIAEAIHDQGLLSDFPGRTTTDFYLWIAEQRLLLQQRTGLVDFAGSGAPHRWRRHFSARSRPLLDRAGRAILNAMIPASFKSGPAVGQWRKTKTGRAVQRLFVCGYSGAAQCRAAQLGRGRSGLEHRAARGRPRAWLAHQRREDGLGSPAVEAVRQEFERRCAAAQAQGSFNLEVGRSA